MKNSKYTPSPWNIKTDILFRSEKLIQIENICVMKGTDNQAEANAKLIASAPELLEACQRAKIFMELFSPNKLGDGSQNSRDLEFVINAIKKATE